MIAAGQVVARLDPQNQQNALRSAEANLASAEAPLTQARLTFGRQQELLKNGWTPRAKFDEAQQALRTAEAQVDSAQAQVRIAQDQLSYTILRADRPGRGHRGRRRTGRGGPAGQMIVQLAGQGGRDAVFDVPEQLIRTGPRDPVVEIALTDDPQVRATGRVREVAPQADSATRTFQVKVGIIDPPEAMRLGSTVTGRIKLAAPPGRGGPGERAHRRRTAGPAVWVVDPPEPDRVAAHRRRRALRSGERRDLAGARDGRRRGHRRRADAAPGPEGPPAGRRLMNRFNLSEWALRHRSLVTYFMLMIMVAGVGPTSGSAAARIPTSRSRPWWCRRTGPAPRSRTRSSRSPTASSASCRRRRTSTT